MFPTSAPAPRLAPLLSFPCSLHSGIFGERLPLRYYLSVGMVLSGIFTALFGFGYFWNIHVLWYFIVVQVWPDLISVLAFPPRSVWAPIPPAQFGRCSQITLWDVALLPPAGKNTHVWVFALSLPGVQWAGTDDRLARSRGMRRELVWEGEVSARPCPRASCSQPMLIPLSCPTGGV